MRDFQELLNRPAEKLPPGPDWATIEEMCVACGKSPGNNKLIAKVRELVAAGKYEKFSGTKYAPDKKQVFNQTWYRPASK